MRNSDVCPKCDSTKIEATDGSYMRLECQACGHRGEAAEFVQDAGAVQSTDYWTLFVENPNAIFFK